MKTKKRIAKITIQHIPDDSPDTSYLEQEGFEDRLEEYRQGMFDFVGIRAKAEIWIPTGNNCDLRQEITSGGLWGIESDSGEDYFTSVAAEELGQLRQQLEALGFKKHNIAVACHALPNLTGEVR